MNSQLIPPAMLTVPRTSMATNDMMDISMEHGMAAEFDKPSAFAEAIKTLGRHKLLAALVASLVFSTGAAVTLSLPKSYLAKAVVVIPPVDVDPLFNGHTPDASRLDDDRVATEVSMLQSRDTATAVVTRFAAQLTPPRNELEQKLRSLVCEQLVQTAIACPAVTAVPAVSEQVDDFLRRLKVEPEPRSRIIDVSVEAATADLAAAMANAVVEDYQASAVTGHATELNRIVGWVDTRTAELRDRWLDAVRSANNYRVANRLPETFEAANAAGLLINNNQLSQASTSLGDAETKLAQAQAKENALRDAQRAGLSTSLIAFGEQPLVVAQAAALDALLNKQAQLSARFGSGYPELQAVDKSVARARADLNIAVGTALQSIHSDVVAAQAAVAHLKQNLTSLKSDADVQSTPQIEYNILRQEAQSARTVYDTFLLREKELSGRSGILNPPVAFVSHAVVPAKPASPNLGRLLLASFVIALICGCASAVCADYLSSGFSDFRTLREIVPLAMLGVLPLAKGVRRNKLVRYVLDNPYSRASESVRGLITNIALRAGDPHAAQAVLIGSADAQAGKTTLALWLATASAQSGQRVLLIDGDYRRGQVAKRLGGADGPGLTDLLAGQASVAEVVQGHERTGISFISAGRCPSRPLGSNEIERIRALLEEFKHNYSLIVIDSPPLLGMSDGLAYANLADQTIFVCRWRRTSRTAVTTSIERFRSAGARLTGLVLSMVDPRSAQAYGGDYAQREVKMIGRLYGV